MPHPFDREPSSRYDGRVNNFYRLGRVQSAGISETLTTSGGRILRVIDLQTIETHRRLAAMGCPVFEEAAPQSRDSNAEMVLLLPEGTRDVRTLLSQPMDDILRSEVLGLAGRELRKLYEKTQLLPVGDVRDTLAIALQAEDGLPRVFLVPPYAMAEPDQSTFSTLFFTNDPYIQSEIWEGWTDERIG